MSKQTEKVKIFFRYIEVFYEKACMTYADLDRFKMNLDLNCAMNVIKLLTLAPTKVEKCFSDSFTVSEDSYTDNLTLKDHAAKIKVLNTHYQNPNLFIDGEPYHQPLYRDEKFKESQMISDVCAAILANPALKSNFCLVYLRHEEANLEEYQYMHKREIGINFDPQAEEKAGKRLYAFHFWIACIVIVIINLCAWTIARYRTKKAAQERTRE